MTPDERKMLSDLADKIAQTPAPPRDPEAEDFIRSNIGKRPDALYLMTQTVLIQNLALEQAKRQMQDMQARSGQSSGSFLGQSGAAGGGNYSQPGGSYGSGNYPQQQPYYPAQNAAPQPGSGAPSFLRGAAQTAAGVAAGALAFEGIQALFSHPGYGMGGSGFGGFGGGGFGGERPVEETVVNNYYDSPSGGGGNSDLNLTDNRDSLADTGSTDAGDDQYDDSSNADDSSDFDSGSDTSGDDFS